MWLYFVIRSLGNLVFIGGCTSSQNSNPSEVGKLILGSAHSLSQKASAERPPLTRAVPHLRPQPLGRPGATTRGPQIQLCSRHGLEAVECVMHVGISIFQRYVTLC